MSSIAKTNRQPAAGVAAAVRGGGAVVRVARVEAPVVCGFAGVILARPNVEVVWVR